MQKKSALVLIGCFFMFMCYAQQPDTKIKGECWKGTKGNNVKVEDIMKRTRIESRFVQCKAPEPEIEEVDRSNLGQDPLSPKESTFPVQKGNASSALMARPTGPLTTLGTSFTGGTLLGNNPTLSFPSDNMGAVGPTQYIMAVNGRIVTFNKLTGVADGVLNTNTDIFFTSVLNGSSTSDPRIRYDRLSSRWFVVMINVSTPNRILISVSDSASKGIISNSSSWNYFYIPIDSITPGISNKCLMDYPTLGIDAKALYVGGNNFCGSPTQTFNSTDGYVIQKKSILGSGPIVATVFRGLAPTGTSAGPYTPQGVDNFDTSANEGYFIGVDDSLFGRLVLRRVSNPDSTPSISGNIFITVSATTSSINVPHLGNTGGNKGKLEGLDDRLLMAQMRNGRLWTTHGMQVNSSGVASSSGGRMGTRWYELTGIKTGQTPSVVQSGTIFDNSATNPKSYWMPSVMVSGQGHAAFSLTTAGNNNYVNAATTFRLRSGTAGSTQNPVLTTSSDTSYNPPSDQGTTSGGRRWGDYSYIALDPLDDMTMWMINQFCDTTNSYGCNITKLIAPPPATVSTIFPTVVNQGQTSVTVNVTGTTSSGSGYYDPGVNLPSPAQPFNHISAAVSGGVIVNSITYTDSVHVTLNINTASASIGQKTITITNPDGQTVTANNVLTVTSILPVTSLGLSAQLNNNLSVLLKWQTQTEINNKGFYIEKNTTDDINQWERIGFVTGAENSNRPINYSFVDNNVAIGTNYRYRLKQVDNDGEIYFSNESDVTVKDLEKNMVLLSNYPNPFKSISTFTYTIPYAGLVSLKVYDAIGQQVSTVVNEYKQSGVHSVLFDAVKLNLNKGLYYYTLNFGNTTVTKKMILLQ